MKERQIHNGGQLTNKGYPSTCSIQETAKARAASAPLTDTLPDTPANPPHVSCFFLFPSLSPPVAAETHQERQPHLSLHTPGPGVCVMVTHNAKRTVLFFFTSSHLRLYYLLFDYVLLIWNPPPPHAAECFI